MAQAVESTSISLPINREIGNEKNGAEYAEIKNAIFLSVHDASLKETVLGICRSYGLSAIGGVESLSGNITASVKADTPEELIAQLGSLYHFSVTKQHKTLVIEGDGKELEQRELYVLTPQHLTAQSLEGVLGTVVHADKMAVFSEGNEVVLHITNGEKRRVETLMKAVDNEPKQVQLEATIIAMERSYVKETGVRWSWLSLTGHGEDKTHSYGGRIVRKNSGRGRIQVFCET